MEEELLVRHHAQPWSAFCAERSDEIAIEFGSGFVGMSVERIIEDQRVRT